MALQPGSTLGHYEIVSCLGAGGMGEVYRARDTQLGREVAIKVLPTEVAGDAERLSRFEREARVLASLNHPNIATLHGYERDGATAFLVMELVEGETLADRLARGPIPKDEAIPLFLQIAEGLEAAHAKGVVHRDLKPANIKMSPATHTGPARVKILDFGLAKAMAPDTDADETILSNSPTLPLAATRQGQILGTAAYMSPEQASGMPVDKLADNWAFGVVLFEALTGRALFVGDSVSQILAEVLKTEPDWETLPPGTPPSVERLLRRCLAKDPTLRLRDIGDARLDLQDALAEPSGQAPAVSAAPSRSSPLPWLAGIGLGAVVATAAYWTAATLRPEEAAPPPVRTVVSAPPNAPAAISTFGRDLAITSDGRAVVYFSGFSRGDPREVERALPVSGIGRGTRLHVRPLDQLEGKALTGTELIANPFLSPDDRWLVFPDTSDLFSLRTVPLAGGEARTLGRMPGFANGIAWGRDGWIYFGVNRAGGGTGALYRMREAGGEPEVVLSPDDGAGEMSYRWPSLLPNGRTLLFTVLQGSTDDTAKIAALDLSTGYKRIVVERGSNPRYAPTGHLVFGRESKLWAVRFDPEAVVTHGSATPVLESLAAKESGAYDYDFSQSGSMVYVTGGAGEAAKAQLVWVDRRGREETLPAPPRNYVGPELSRDGRRVALTSQDEERDQWVFDLERSSLERVTDHPAQDTYGVWTPDGRSIIFGSARDGAFDLYRKSADGTGTAERLSTSAAARYPFAITPDGEAVIYLEGFPGGHDLGLLSLEDGYPSGPLLDSPSSEAVPDLSPDGRWLAYQSNESGRYEIYVRPFPDVDSGRWPISTGGGRNPRWSRTGSELFYISATGALVSVPVETASGFRAGDPTELFSALPYSYDASRNYAVSPDGQRFLMVKPLPPQGSNAPNQVVLVQNWFDELERLVPAP
jgi:serine/threonine-protein kinase